MSLSALLGLDLLGGGAGEDTSADGKGSNENGELHGEEERLFKNRSNEPVKALKR